MTTQNTDTYDHDAECEESLHAELKSLRAHKARLDTELAEMRKINHRQMNFFQDAAAFIKSEWGNDVVLSTLIHDITGIAEDKPCFVPRVTGYSGKQERNDVL